MQLRDLTLPVIVTLVASLAAAAGPTPVIAQEDGKPRIAVVDFRNHSSSYYGGPELGKAAADELNTQLVQSGDFTVVERSRLRSLIAEQDLGQSGRVDASTAAEIGRLLGVQAIVTGSVTQFSIKTTGGGIGPISARYTNAESVLDVRVVNTETGAIMMAVEGEGSKEFGGAAFEGVNFHQNFNAGLAQEALRPAVEKAVQKIVAKKGELAAVKPEAPPGQVVGVSGQDYYIDRGENFGVETGQRFDVYRVTDEIRNAEGELLDTVTEKVGVLEVTKVLSQSSITELVSGEAQQGDEVRAQEGG